MFAHIKDESSGGHYPPERIATDREGRFRVEALLPGYEFVLSDGEGDPSIGGNDLRSGRTKDLGDVRILGEAR